VVRVSRGIFSAALAMPKRASSKASAASTGSTPAPAALREAPTFCPTEAEFQNPLRYILSIREEAERYGICCIKPPPSWRPPFMIDLNRLRFPTRVQKINELLIRKTQRLKFMKALAEFCDAAGTPLSKLPTMGGREIDLHLLYTQVGKRGGFERATAERKWTEIAERMNMHHASGSHLAAALKKQYQQLLLPYERYAAGLDPPPAGIAAAAAAAAASAEAAAPAPQMSSGGSLMSKRANVSGAEVVRLSGRPGGVERSNAAGEDEVIAYEPPLPGQELCEICGSGDEYESMLLCDRCGCGFHLQCLNPPLHAVPAGEWFCAQCLQESFGFDSTRVFRFHQYERQAHMFKHAFFDGLVETGLSKKSRAEGVAHSAEARAQSGARLRELEVPPEEVEWQFWNVVTTPDQPLEVLYAAELL
jgi:histone demethylase JARID1